MISLELIVSITVFLLTAFAFLFSLTRTSGIEAASFPNRGRFFIGLIFWLSASILAVFMSFPGYADWFLPPVYPILKIALLVLFATGFFLLLTTVMAFPVHFDYFRREVGGRSDRIAVLENIRQIAAQPYPVTESFTLVLREIASFLVIKKAAAFLINPTRREMYLVAQLGLDRDELQRLERFPLGQDIVSRAAREQSPYVSGDLTTTDSPTRRLILAGRQTPMSLAAIPLYVRDRSLGALVVISEKLFGFEKRDRMLLSAASEALAGVVENNRLTRENHKLQTQMEDRLKQLQGLRGLLSKASQAKLLDEVLRGACRYIAERYNLPAVRLIRQTSGNFEDVSSIETVPGFILEGESYRVAVINAIRQGKAVILNQEAIAQSGEKYIARSTLLYPILAPSTGRFAFLLEAPGNELKLTEGLVDEVEGIINLISVILEISDAEKMTRQNQLMVGALLNILKINGKSSEEAIFKRFIEELGNALGNNTSLLIFNRDQNNGYRLVGSYRLATEKASECTFMPGEGPIGKVAATGEIIDLSDHEQISKAWGDLEPINQDYTGQLFGEQGIPSHQLFVPIRAVDDIVGVAAVLRSNRKSGFGDFEKGLILLAAQLLSIRLSMFRMDEGILSDLETESVGQVGHVLNRINNDLATVLGRAQLMARQADISGRTRYTTQEIIKSAESAAASIKHLQESISLPEKTKLSKSAGTVKHLAEFISSRHVTGNLYMFDGNQPVMLQTDMEDIDNYFPGDDQLNVLIETVLCGFINILEESEELCIQAKELNGFTYLTLLRGNRERMGQFDPDRVDFGSPDVMPRDIINETQLPVLARNKGEVSFDRFGRRPTYISFRFPLPFPIEKSQETDEGRLLAGLKILAIDDQQMILDLLFGICASLGIELDTLLDPTRAVEMFRTGGYDLVMVDLVMDELSGWEVAEQIKSIAPDIPIILMTGWDLTINPEEAGRRGIDFTLAKPFKIEQLTEIISMAHKKRLSRRDIS